MSGDNTPDSASSRADAQPSLSRLRHDLSNDLAVVLTLVDYLLRLSPDRLTDRAPDALRDMRARLAQARERLRSFG